VKYTLLVCTILKVLEGPRHGGSELKTSNCNKRHNEPCKNIIQHRGMCWCNNKRCLIFNAATLSTVSMAHGQISLARVKPSSCQVASPFLEAFSFSPAHFHAALHSCPDHPILPHGEPSIRCFCNIHLSAVDTDKAQLCLAFNALRVMHNDVLVEEMHCALTRREKYVHQGAPFPSAQVRCTSQQKHQATPSTCTCQPYNSSRPPNNAQTYGHTARHSFSVSCCHGTTRPLILLSPLVAAPGLITDVTGRLGAVWDFHAIWCMVCNARTNGLTIMHDLLL
jgi:hypothetical protein